MSYIVCTKSHPTKVVFWRKDRDCCNKKILENFFVQFLVLYHQPNLTVPVHHTSLDISHTRECQAWSILHDIFLQHIYILKERKDRKGFTCYDHLCMYVFWSVILPISIDSTYSVTSQFTILADSRFCIYLIKLLIHGIIS